MPSSERGFAGRQRPRETEGGATGWGGEQAGEETFGQGDTLSAEGGTWGWGDSPSWEADTEGLREQILLHPLDCTQWDSPPDPEAADMGEGSGGAHDEQACSGPHSGHGNRLGGDQGRGRDRGTYRWDSRWGGTDTLPCSPRADWKCGICPAPQGPGAWQVGTLCDL